MRFIRPAALFVLALIAASGPARAEGAAYLTIQGQGLAPDQAVTLSTGPQQQLSATASNTGTVAFSNLKYTPTTSLVFSLSYKVKGGAQTISNALLINLDPFVGSVGVRGSASRAASIVVNVGSEDSEAMVADNKGYFSGSADSLTGFDDGNLKIVTNIINVAESCCPRNFKPYLPVTITITAQGEIPAKKAQRPIVATTETAYFERTVPESSFGVSVPADLINGSWVNGMRAFANRTTEYLLNQTTSQGTLLQGQTQIDTMRSLQAAQASAAKNYLPSEQLCRFATLSQSLGSSEALNASNKQAISKALMRRELATANTVGAEGDTLNTDMQDHNATNCNPSDGNMSSQDCKSTNAKRYNSDVDYTRTIDAPMTLNINFGDKISQPEEQDIIKMGDRLFPAKSQQTTPSSKGYISNSVKFGSLQAMRNVAKNSFISLLAEKSQGTAGSAEFIKALMKPLGVPAEQAEALMGAKPSYYAQMEVLTKKLYQDPAFYMNLVDTPSNVDRQRVAMRAIKLQQQNDFAQVVKRREMLLTTLLELKLREQSIPVNQRLRPSK